MDRVALVILDLVNLERFCPPFSLLSKEPLIIIYLSFKMSIQYLERISTCLWYAQLSSDMKVCLI